MSQKWPLEDGPEGQYGKGWLIEDVPVIFLLLKCSKIRLLFPPQDPDNQKEFISLVMESGDLVGKWINRTDLGDIAGSATSVRKDNKGTFRNKNGLSGPYRFMQWKFVAERMKECAALLRENGRMLGEYYSLSPLAKSFLCLTTVLTGNRSTSMFGKSWNNSERSQEAAYLILNGHYCIACRGINCSIYRLYLYRRNMDISVFSILQLPT